MKPLKIRLSPVAFASHVTASPIFGDVRVEGWIVAPDIRSATLDDFAQAL